MLRDSSIHICTKLYRTHKKAAYGDWGEGRGREVRRRHQAIKGRSSIEGQRPQKKQKMLLQKQKRM
jgi:hypothetical protein